MITIETAALNLAAALILGSIIGLERQWRQRLAGLRTNVLVALGAASFTVFAALFPEELSPTRVAAQIVTGIGFLGAGIIFRDGLSIKGLNTAATIWCSASVGMLAGVGALDIAALVTGMIIIVNLFLRPLADRINRQPNVFTESPVSYAVNIVCEHDKEAHVRALLLQGFSANHLHLKRLDSCNIEDSSRVEVTAHVSAKSGADELLEQIVGRLSLESSVTAARWRTIEEEE